MTTAYTPTIGLEIHAELKTKTKMFCDCANAPHDSEPNLHVCEICLAHPGTLPRVNKHAVQQVLLVGAAIDGTLADEFTEFDRKHYFYPDIPKAYQISQLHYPLVRGGSLAGVSITRIHLEEDTARSGHDDGQNTVVDFNRAGVPLMELVTEPVIYSAEQAATFARELQLLLRTLGVSDANMERGEMRVEANISVSNSDTMGTKVEVKNINSFKAVSAAIAYEIMRQVKVLEAGESVVQQTRGWDENKGVTFMQRVKETSDDYRYFPDPDIPKLRPSEIAEFQKARLNEILPKLAPEKRVEYKNLGLASSAIEIIIADKTLDGYFAKIATLTHDTEVLKRCGNYLTSDVLSLLEDGTVASLEMDSAEHFLALMCLLGDKEITSRVAKDLLPEVLNEDTDPRRLVEERGLKQSNSAADLEPLIAAVIAEQPQAVEEYKAGKESVVQFLVGQAMKKSSGSANPDLAKQLFIEKLTT